MNKLLPFKAWYNGTMHSVYAVKWCKDGVYLLLGDEQSSITVLEDECEICRPTYMYDEYGNAIYEHDIVIVNEIEEDQFKDIVEFAVDGSPMISNEGDSLDSCSLEVIGNRFGNPELLKTIAI